MSREGKSLMSLSWCRRLRGSLICSRKKPLLLISLLARIRNSKKIIRVVYSLVSRVFSFLNLKKITILAKKEEVISNERF